MSKARIQLLKQMDRWLGVPLTRLLPGPGARQQPAGSNPRFLLIRPGGIGDAVLLAPAILTLKSVYPASRITVLAESRNGAVFSLCPAVDQVCRYDRPAELWACLRQSYEVVIDSEQWHRLSAMVARLTRAGLRVGFATNERRRLFHEAVAYDHDDYEAVSFSRLLDFLGPRTTEAGEGAFLRVPQEARRRLAALFPAGMTSPLVVLFPGASIPERRWGAVNFARLAGLCKEHGLAVAVVGGVEDRDDGERIVADGCGLNLAGRTSLTETAAVIQRAVLLVGGDSGVLHIGVGLGIPTVSLFGPGIARKWAPVGAGHVVVNKHLPCSPCTRFGYTPPCPRGGPCLSEITVDEVFAAALTLVHKKNSD